MPRGIQSDASPLKNPLVVEVIWSYENSVPSRPSMLSATMGDFLGVRVSSTTAEWVDVFIKNTRMRSNNSPGTIRKKAGVYGRILDWHFRRTIAHGEQKPANPFRHLPRGYSTYTTEEAAALRKASSSTSPDKPKLAQRDQTRDHRLVPGKSDRIDMALRGERLPGAKWGQPAPLPTSRCSTT